MQKQDAGTRGSLNIPAIQFIAHKHTSLLDFFTTSHKLFFLPSLMHVLIQRHSGHTGHKATHWGGEEGRAGDSLEPIKLFYGNQESMKLLYKAMALQVWTSYRFSQNNSTLKERHGQQAREFQGTLAPGVRVAAQTHQVSGCRESGYSLRGYLVTRSKFVRAGLLVWVLRASSEASHTPLPLCTQAKVTFFVTT